jgi:hypothetical protein
MSAATFLRTLDDEVKKMVAIQSGILLGKTLCCIRLGIYVSSNNKWLCFLLLYVISLARSHYRDFFYARLLLMKSLLALEKGPRRRLVRLIMEMLVGRGSLYVCQKGDVCRTEPTEDYGVEDSKRVIHSFNIRLAFFKENALTSPSGLAILKSPSAAALTRQARRCKSVYHHAHINVPQPCPHNTFVMQCICRTKASLPPIPSDPPAIAVLSFSAHCQRMNEGRTRRDHPTCRSFCGGVAWLLLSISVIERRSTRSSF